MQHICARLTMSTQTGTEAYSMVENTLGERVGGMAATCPAIRFNTGAIQSRPHESGLISERPDPQHVVPHGDAGRDGAPAEADRHCPNRQVQNMPFLMEKWERWCGGRSRQALIGETKWGNMMNMRIVELEWHCSSLARSTLI